jgi:hypothetical protein
MNLYTNRLLKSKNETIKENKKRGINIMGGRINEVSYVEIW